MALQQWVILTMLKMNQPPQIYWTNVKYLSPDLVGQWMMLTTDNGWISRCANFWFICTGMRIFGEHIFYVYR